MKFVCVYAGMNTAFTSSEGLSFFLRLEELFFSGFEKFRTFSNGIRSVYREMYENVFKRTVRPADG